MQYCKRQWKSSRIHTKVIIFYNETYYKFQLNTHKIQINRKEYHDKSSCYECGKEGHLSYACPTNKLGERQPPPKKQRVRRKIKVYLIFVLKINDLPIYSHDFIIYRGMMEQKVVMNQTVIKTTIARQTNVKIWKL